MGDLERLLEDERGEELFYPRDPDLSSLENFKRYVKAKVGEYKEKLGF